MSDSFSQHDEMLPIGQCALCDADADPVDDEGRLRGEIFQLIDGKGVSLIVCERHWWRAWHNAFHINIEDGVHTIIEPTAAEREARQLATVEA